MPILPLIILAMLTTQALAQEPHKCKVGGSMVYQDSPCKTAAPVKPSLKTDATPPATEKPDLPPATDTQTRLARDKKYLADLAVERQKTELREKITTAENEIAQLQYGIDQSMARRTDYNTSARGLLASQLEEERAQTYIAKTKSQIDSRYRDIDSYRRDLEKIK